MGLLDDAIREHLELKRRHGADPGEVERQEREALGSPRAATETAAPAAPPAATDEPEHDVAALAPEDHELARSAPAAPPPEPDAIPEPPVEPAAAPPAPAHTAEHRGAVSADRFSAEEDLDWSDPAPLDDTPEAAVTGEEPVEEDVLEETPEFLQETPEHDRLWFEQRPPRDFDF